MAKPVVIFGIGDFARVASVYLTHDSPHEVAAFTVHREYLTSPSLLGKPVVPFEELDRDYPPDRFDMLVAIGFKGINKVRAALYHECKARGYELIRSICSKAAVWGEVECGTPCCGVGTTSATTHALGATVSSRRTSWSPAA